MFFKATVLLSLCNFNVLFLSALYLLLLLDNEVKFFNLLIFCLIFELL